MHGSFHSVLLLPVNVLILNVEVIGDGYSYPSPYECETLSPEKKKCISSHVSNFMKFQEMS